MPRGFSETKAYYKKNAFYKIFYKISLKTSYGVSPFWIWGHLTLNNLCALIFILLVFFLPFPETPKYNLLSFYDNETF